MNDVTYSDTIRDMIIANLDGWQVITPVSVDEEKDDEEGVDDSETNVEETTETTTTTATDDDSVVIVPVNPFMTSNEANDKANKTITNAECRLFYEEALDLAYMHTNRLNIDDLTEVEARVFLRGVCKWAASNLWNKYNIRVNNEDMEDTYVQSYGGLLYKSALKTLQQFINQRITGISSYTNDDSVDDIWTM